MKRYYGKFLIAAWTLTAGALLAQNLAPTPPYSDQAELSKVEEWVLSQGAAESIAQNWRLYSDLAVTVSR